jgi:hypothetical protein
MPVPNNTAPETVQRTLSFFQFIRRTKSIRQLIHSTKKPIMRKVITFLLLFFAFAANSQTNNSGSGKLRVFSTLGISKVDDDYKPATGNSIQTTTGLEVSLSRQAALGAALSFDSYGYEKTGTGYNLDGSLRATALALFFRYKFGTGAWQPYLKAGGGTTWLSLPTVSVAQSVANIKNETQNVGMAMAEAGFQIRVLPRYSLLVAGERKWMGKSSLADNTSLRTMGFKLGLISSF